MIIIPAAPTRSDACHDPRSAAAETAWLPIIGPGAMALLRLTPTMWAVAAPWEITDSELARSLGLPTADRARNAASRLARFGVARWDAAAGTLEVPTSVHLPSAHQVQRAADRFAAGVR